MFNKKQEQAVYNGRMDTIIGKETVMEGTLVASGTVRVDGKLDGEIKIKGDLFIGENAIINAEVTAQNMVLAGRLKGNVQCDGKLEIQETGKLEGDIKVNSLMIDDGAFFRGKSEMVQSGSMGVPVMQVAEEKKNNKQK